MFHPRHAGRTFRIVHGCLKTISSFYQLNAPPGVKKEECDREDTTY